MPKDEFIQQLRQMGYAVADLGGGRVAFPYEIPCGKFAGRKIKLGFTVPPDFPLTPPSGPHISPRLMPNQSGGAHPTGGIHDSPSFGTDWHYWSRPISHWNDTTRTVKDVMAHVRHLFDTL
jgi:hypothetical protein